MLSDLADLQHAIPDWLHDTLSRPRTSGTLQVLNCPIHYFSWGNPANQGLVFLHGRMSHAHCWAFIAPLLADDYHCVAIDLSGMGDSGHRNRYQRATRAEEVKSVTEHLGMFAGAQKPLLITHSYGAVVGCDVLAMYPSKFSGIIACDPSLHQPDEWSSLQPRQDSAELSRPHRVYPDLATGMRRFKFAPTQDSVFPVLEEYIARHSLRRTKSGWCWKFDPLVYSAFEEGHDDWWVQHTQNLLKLPVPRAIVYGDKSSMIDKAIADAVVAHTTDKIAVYEIPNAAHHIMVDQPWDLKKAIHDAAIELSSATNS